MKYLGWLLLAHFLAFGVSAQDIRFDELETNHWIVVNDTVMGGQSSSRFYYENEVGIFAGNVSLENNGGFASVRRLIAPEFRTGSIIRLTLKGDGRNYQFRLKTHQLYEGAAYVTEFTTQAGQWQSVQLTESDFTPRFRGRFIAGAPSLKFSDAKQVGLLIGDKRQGTFKLEIQAIEVLDII